MKILVLTKRQYMGKDLLDDRFGRFWELPLELTRLGHEVRGLAFSYRLRSDEIPIEVDSLSGGKMSWASINLLNSCLPQIERYTRRALQISQKLYVLILSGPAQMSITPFSETGSPNASIAMLIDSLR